MTAPSAAPARSSARAASWIVLPSLKDPRVTLSIFLTFYTVLGQTALYFNRDLRQILLSVGTACLVEVALVWLISRVLLLPLSAYITGLGIGILLESYDARVFVVAAAWAIVSKFLIRDRHGHIFNPSNFGVIAALALSHGLATVAPGSQWGGQAWIAVLILILGSVMMYRIGRFDLVGTWILGFVLMGALRMALGQGSLVFALGPMLSGEFVLYSYSMIPDPKTSPPTRTGRILWGAGLALMDGALRFFEIRYSMVIALFVFCAALPLFRGASNPARRSESGAR